MVKTITTYTAGSILATILFFGLALQAFAYDDLEIEIYFDDGKTEVDVEYDEDGSEVEIEFEYETVDLDEVYAKIATELGISEEAVEAAVTEIEYSDDEDEDEDEDEKEDDDDYDDDKKRPAACDKSVRGNAYGMWAKCDDDRPVAERIRELKEKRDARCEAATLDGEVDRKDYFCRNGEWREKREARLDDLLSGAVESADLSEQQAEVIRDEMIDLIRQLITRLFQDRFGV